MQILKDFTKAWDMLQFFRAPPGSTTEDWPSLKTVSRDRKLVRGGRGRHQLSVEPPPSSPVLSISRLS